MENEKICPVCNKGYNGRPALSRRDNRSMICPDCGMLEALDAARIMIGQDLSDEEWEKYKKNFLEECKGGTHG